MLWFTVCERLALGVWDEEEWEKPIAEHVYEGMVSAGLRAALKPPEEEEEEVV